MKALLLSEIFIQPLTFIKKIQKVLSAKFS